MNIQEITELLTNVAFPILISFYLLHRIEKELKTLNETMMKLSLNISKLDEKNTH